jgi:serine/threonine protein kinase
VIGAEKFGVVYRARDLRTSEIVVIKCPCANSVNSNARYLSSFTSDVCTLERCSGYPSIVQPHDFDLLSSEAFLAMEFVVPILKHVMKLDRFRRRHTEMAVRLVMSQVLADVRRMNRLGSCTA